jgi:sugar phosphate isomerase/epimerase
MTAPFLDDPYLVLAWGTVRPASFADRVAAASAAGYPAIGLAVPDYLALRAAGWTDDAMLALLAEHDVRIDEVEVLFGFHAPTGPANLPHRPGLVYADPEVERTAFHLADVFGVRRAQAVGTLDDRPLGPEVAEAFAELCDRAAEHGLQVALEFVPYSSIKDIRTAAAIVEEAGRPNGGLCIDTWHFFRGEPDLEALAAVPADRIQMVQVNDGPAVPDDPDRMADAVHGRRLPGDGAFDLAAFVAALDRPGVAPAISVEVYSDALHRRPSADAARMARDATIALLDKGSGTVDT